MRSRKQNLKVKARNLPLRLKRALQARKRISLLSRRSRLLLSYIRYLRPKPTMKRSKRLFPRLARYRRSRRRIILSKTVATLDCGARRKGVPYTRNAFPGSALTPNLYSSRRHVLRAARHKVRYKVRQYRRLASRFRRVRLRHARRLLQQQRSARHKKRRTRKYTRRMASALRLVRPFLRTRVRRILLKSASKRYLRVKSFTVRGRSVVNGMKRALVTALAGRAAPAFRRGPLLVHHRARGAVFLLRRLSKRRRARRKFVNVRGRKYAVLRSRVGGARRRSIKRLKRCYPRGLRQWLCSHRVRRRPSLRARYRTLVRIRRRSGRTKVRKVVDSLVRVKRGVSLQKHAKGRFQRFRRPFTRRERRRAQRRLERRPNRAKIARRRRKWRKSALRRRLRRLQRVRFVRNSPTETIKKRKVHANRFFRRQKARRQLWLDAISTKTRRATQLFVKVSPGRVSKLSSVPRNSTLFLLRSALHTRSVRYVALRKRKILRTRRRMKHCRRVRRRGCRRFVYVKWGKARFALRREHRKNRRDFRHAYKMRRWRGRTWARWRRMPRRFLGSRGRAVRRLFRSRPRLFRRGRWTYFYRDRDFAPRPKAKWGADYMAHFDYAYHKPERTPLVRPRRTQQPQWHSPTALFCAAQTAILKKHKRLAQLVRRRLVARRQVLPGTAYSLQNRSILTRITKAVTRKTLRRMCGRRVRHYRPRCKTTSLYITPRVIRTRATRRAGLLLSAAFASRRLRTVLLRRVARPTCAKKQALTPIVGVGRFAPDLQRELIPAPSYTLDSKSFKKIKKTPYSKRRAARRGGRKATWFSLLKARLLLLKEHLYEGQQIHQPKSPRAVSRVLKSLYFEVELSNSVESALELRSRPLVKLNSKTRLATAAKTHKKSHSNTLRPCAPAHVIKNSPRRQRAFVVKSQKVLQPKKPLRAVRSKRAPVRIVKKTPHKQGIKRTKAQKPSQVNTVRPRIRKLTPADYKKAALHRKIAHAKAQKAAQLKKTLHEVIRQLTPAKVVPEIAGPQTVQKNSPASHKSWPTSPHPTPSCKPGDPQKKKKK